MSKLKTLVLIGALSFAGFATAALDPLTNVLELRYEHVSVPGHEADRVSMRECDDCPSETVRATSGTVYRFNGEVLPLAKFRAALRRTNNRDDLIIYVKYDVKTRLMTEMVASGA